MSITRRNVLRGNIALALVLTANDITLRSGCAAAKSYFPKSAFRDLGEYDADEPEAWSRYLRLFNEPVLFQSHDSRFSIRLAIAPAFSDGYVIRIMEGARGRITGVKKRLRRADLLAVSSPLNVTMAELQQIKRMVSEEKFWNLTNRQEVVVTDGVRLLLEVKDGTRYHAVYSPGLLDNGFSRIARILMTLASVEVPV